MHAIHKALAAALALGSAFAAPAPAPARGAVQEPAAQTEPPRRPQGPAAGPVIKLPRSESLGDERATQQPAASGDERAAPAGPQRWEYCSINGFVYHQRGLGLSGPHVPAAVIRYFGGSAEEVEGAYEDDAVANAFAKLGEEGWELAGVRTDLALKDGHGKSAAVYFFKRPKRRE
jgi:hypothetical protein